MKKEGVVKILLCSFLFVFLLSSIMASAPVPGTCEISLRNECVEADGNYILMGLTSSTNAHAQVVEQTPEYGYVLCCALGTGVRTCDETNKIIGLSSTTNAHAEKPSLTTYTIPVCYEDFECKGSISACGTGDVASYPTGILSLTAETNAHIGNSTDYPIKICCKSSLLPYSCSISSASWSVENAISGQRVRLDVTGAGSKCDGESIAFKVSEYDFGGTDSPVTTNPINVAFDGNKATGIWYAEWQDDGVLGGDPKYYFNVSRVKNKGISLISSDPKLSVTETNLVKICSTVSTCIDYSSQVQCESDAGLCRVAGSSNLPEVDCNADNIVCGCSWDTTTNQCGFGYNEIDPNDCGNPTDGCKYGCTLCNTTTTPSTTYCGLGSTCEGGIIAEQINGSCDPGIDGCGSVDCNNGDKDTCAAGLYCLTDKCSSVEGPPLSLGNCKISQSIEKDCDVEPVGYKIITWTGIWSLPSGFGPAYDRCIAGGRTTIPCPAQIQLPFFDYYELILTVIVIALIYVSLIFRRKFWKKSKAKGKK